MNTGYVYTITLGKYSDKYLCTFNDLGQMIFRRVRMPKNKIDAIRLPENIHITEFAKSLIKPNKNAKK